MSEKNCVIIDTDCGIDDSLAISLAAYCQQRNLLQVLAITCTHGNTSVVNVVKNVCLTLRASGLLVIRTLKRLSGLTNVNPQLAHCISQPYRFSHSIWPCIYISRYIYQKLT